MTQAELNKKAVKSIFAIDDAKAQLESFGSQLDLGLPPEEDYEPKSFDDLMTVNPSNDTNYGESSEKFADLGDDLQDEQTQKFVIDEFAKQAAKRPGNTITASDIADICGAVQCAQLAKGGQIIKGDMVSFIQDTIAKAKTAQQSQNVSDAQPNGTVADDIAPAGDAEATPAEAPVDAPVDDPAAVGGPAPVMDPIAPTVEPTEPSLEPNADDGLGADPLAADDGLGALDTGIEGDPAAIAPDIPDEPAPAEDAEPDLDANNLNGLDDLDNDLGDINETDDLNLDDDAPKADESADTEKKDEPKEDDSKDEPKDDKKDDGDKDDKKDDSDDDFNFEAVAKKAQALTEGAEEEAVAAAEPAEAAASEAAVPEGEAVATTESTEEPAAEETPVTECGAAPAADEKPVVQEGAEEAEIEAKVEAIAKEFRSNRIAEKVQAQIEAYEAKEKKEKTIAQLEAVISNFEKSEQSRSKSAKVESIVANFAKASKEAAEKAQLEAEAAKANALQGKLDNILESIEVAPKAEPVVESTEQSKVESYDKTIAMIESALSTMGESDKEVKTQLESIVDDAAKRSESDSLQKELDAIVESVRKS